MLFTNIILGVLITLPIHATEKLVELSDICQKSLSALPGKKDSNSLSSICKKVSIIEGCSSVESQPIFHYEKEKAEVDGKRIMVISLIHGDEVPSGTVARFWMEKVDKINPRNTWRIIPILNPDGLKKKTRTNARKIDINRNFPTLDWTQNALSYWKKHNQSNPRRFPGNEAASEPETKCALKHIEDFKPDFIVSIHTPLKVLDFDGPKLNFPKFDYLPWKSLGHYPGSLGRFMWSERQIPVLTMELKDSLPANMETFWVLQNIIGQLAKFENKNQKDSKTVSFNP